MNQIQFIGTTPHELIADIKNAIIPELYKQLSEKFQPQQPEEFLSRNEVCALLKINLTTLWRYTNKGLLTGYNLEKKVLFKRSEIEAYLENNKTN